MNSKKSKKSDPRFAYEGLDRVIHERARLSVLTSLITHGEGLMFNELKELCALTDGNLNRHLQVLEEAKLVGKCVEVFGWRPAGDPLPCYGPRKAALYRIFRRAGTGDFGRHLDTASGIHSGESRARKS